MNARLTPITICLAACLAVFSVQGQAGFKGFFKKPATQNASVPAQLPAQPPAQAYPSLPSASYPNGLGWRAIESDFIDVKARIDEVEGKVDAVKADTDQILFELDDVNADHIVIKNELADIKSDLGMVKSDIADIETGLVDISDELAAVAGDVAMLKNTLKLQLSVSLAGADEVNDLPVTLYVQVIQNGAGVSGLTPDAFTFSSSFPSSAAGYCGTVACFSEGANGLYALQLEGDWDATAYAGTLAAEHTVVTSAGDVTSTGASLATFEIPAAP